MRIRNPEEVLEKYPHQLSGGMLQRIMIGIATSMEPALLVADEPTTAIDAITQLEILDELVRIKREAQTAMIFITHDLNAISRVADRVVVLNQGRWWIGEILNTSSTMPPIHTPGSWWRRERMSCAGTVRCCRERSGKILS